MLAENVGGSQSPSWTTLLSAPSQFRGMPLDVASAEPLYMLTARGTLQANMRPSLRPFLDGR